MISKVLSFVILTACLIGYTFGQEPPKEGASINMLQTNFNLTPGTIIEQKLTLLRSKRTKRINFEGLAARTSDDLAIKFQQDPKNIDTYIMSLEVKENAIERSYTVVVKGEGNNAHKIKGKAITINVTGSGIVKSNE